MPCSAVAYQNDDIIRIGHGQMIEKHIHTICVTIRHNQEAAFTADWFNRSVNISVFSDVMARNRRTDSLFTPAVFRFIDSTKTRFVLKHQTHCGIVEFFRSFLYELFNFFEASIASGLAFFGCRLLGIIFLHPCRRSTKYICPELIL